MLQYDPLDCLPSAEDLPDSDDTPVDNELQDLILGLLKAILAFVWADRMDWFFGVDMGIYYDPDRAAIVPDGFLSLGVERILDENLRLSYVLWEEQRVPIMTLEVVSHKRRGEYSTKKEFYAQLEVLYYVVYNPQRRRKPVLEVYRLVNGKYQLQRGNPVWLPEIGLGIGSERGTYLGISREWLYWYNEQGKRLLAPEERVQQAEQRAQMLAERLKSLGVDPDSLV
ncbi:Uma2 family endonuclease [Nostocaceae cyanobacterium CENA369]|uniref:Uma2 family endonuclease n=1 Tax=Dendronalium phyllosphericum CENA369 TaxID=1725256 RepID=A0A8J7I6X2_9NOST|nr:Uma2 family endonuclease [Dendronalium phyllosphericum]MBH8572702.1 Uma2 family endonuclease [Dendronalium phyllosphericum CENA369]